MSKLDQMIAAGRTDLATLREVGGIRRAGAQRAAEAPFSPGIDAPDVAQDIALEIEGARGGSKAAAHEHAAQLRPARPPEPAALAGGAARAMPAPEPQGPPTPARLAALRMATAEPAASRVPGVPVAAAERADSSAAPQPPAAQRAARTFHALAGAWMEQPAVPQPLVARPQIAPAPRHQASASLPAERAPHTREPVVSPAAPASTPRTTAPQRAATVARAPAPRAAMPSAHDARTARPPSELVVEHLDVRVITEPPPRATVKPAASRAPARQGAWRASVRRFLERR